MRMELAKEQQDHTDSRSSADALRVELANEKDDHAKSKRKVIELNEQLANEEHQHAGSESTANRLGEQLRTTRIENARQQNRIDHMSQLNEDAWVVANEARAAAKEAEKWAQKPKMKAWTSRREQRRPVRAFGPTF